MIKMKKLTSVVLAGSLLLGVPIVGDAKTKKVKKDLKEVQYVALGDSLAVGLLPEGYIDYGYPDYIADSFVKNKYKLIDYDNFGIPGYTSEKLKNDVLKSKKIRKEIKEATHVTIDIGAVDFKTVAETDPTKAPEVIPNVSANLQTILSTIDKINPKVKVYVMGYYNPFPLLPKEQQEPLLPVLQALNTQIQTVAKANKDVFIPVEELIASKSSEYLPNPLDPHLSDKGYKAVANAFWKEIANKK